MKTYTVNKIEIRTHKTIEQVKVCQGIKDAIYWQGQFQRAEKYQSPFAYTIKAFRNN